MNVQTRTRATAALAADEPPPPQLPATVKPRAATPLPEARPAEPLVMSASLVLPPALCKSILEVTRAIGAIAKNGRNTFQNYDYQKWDDVLVAIGPLLAEHDLMILPSEIGKNLVESNQIISITYEFLIFNSKGEVWPERPVWTATARLRDSKGVCDDKAASKCSTQAHKEFLIKFFKIRTSDAITTDGDGDGRTINQRSTQRADEPAPPAARPHAIRPNGRAPEDWADAYLAACQASQSSDELELWETRNADFLAKLDRLNPELRTEIARQVMRIARGLEGDPSATETVTWADGDDGSDEPPAAMDPPMGQSGRSRAVQAQRNDLEQTLLREIDNLATKKGCLEWAQRSNPRLAMLPDAARRRVDVAFHNKQDGLGR